MDKYSFQYCQKIVVFNDDFSKVLLAKRKGENDFDGTYSFIGGKMERTDQNLIEGMRREKTEEVGSDCRLKIYPDFSTNGFYIKKDGSSMVLPHYVAQYVHGEIKLNDEYSDFQWVPVSQLSEFKPMISTVPKVVENLLKLMPIIKTLETVII